jgi:hypothetical protein
MPPPTTLQQRADRRLAVFGLGELGNIGRDLVIDRLDRAFRDGDADQHCGDGLGHGLREKAVAIGARICGRTSVSLEATQSATIPEVPERELPRHRGHVR